MQPHCKHLKMSVTISWKWYEEDFMLGFYHAFQNISLISRHQKPLREIILSMTILKYHQCGLNYLHHIRYSEKKSEQNVLKLSSNAPRATDKKG